MFELLLLSFVLVVAFGMLLPERPSGKAEKQSPRRNK